MRKLKETISKRWLAVIIVCAALGVGASGYHYTMQNDTFLLMSAASTDTMAAYRVLTAGDGVGFSDGGAGSTYTVAAALDDVDQNLLIDGAADEVQLTVQGNATQTSNLVSFEQSDGTAEFTVSNAGLVTVTGSVVSPKYVTADADPADAATGLNCGNNETCLAAEAATPGTDLTFKLGTDDTWTSDAGLTASAGNIVVTSGNATLASGHFRSTGANITAGGGDGTVNDAGTLRQQVYKWTVDYTEIEAAATTEDITIATLPDNTILRNVIADVTTEFACAAVCTSSTLSFTTGKSAGGNEYIVSSDADAAVAVFGDADGELGTSINAANGPDRLFGGTTTLQMRFTSGTGNLGDGAGTTNLSQGSITFYVVAEVMP